MQSLTQELAYELIPSSDATIQEIDAILAELD